MVIKEFTKLTWKQYKRVRAVIEFFHLMGITDEQLELLPQVLQNWPTVSKNMNSMSKDLFEVKNSVQSLVDHEGIHILDDEKKKQDTGENIRNSAGVGKDIERINIDFGSFKKGN